MSETQNFFISYTGADKEWAKWIAGTLEKADYTCIYQARDFVPGENFMQQMHLALSNSEQVIAILSPGYLESEYAGAEFIAPLVHDPLGNKRTLVPVRIKECEPKGMLSGRIYIDLVGKDNEEAEHELLSGIAASRFGKWSASGSENVHSAQAPVFPGQAKTTEQVSQASPVKPSETINILFLGSDVDAELDLKGQAEQIEKILSKPSVQGRFDFKAHFNITTEGIFEILNEYNPHIVHFSGKQNGGNIVIRKPSGGITTIPDLALAGLLQNLGNNVVMAIIDTCKSSRCARTIAKSVPFTMGVESNIYDADAILFYNAFYNALASGRSISAACGQAKAALEFNKIPKDRIPQLFHQKGIDPKTYYFLLK